MRTGTVATVGVPTGGRRHTRRGDDAESGLSVPEATLGSRDSEARRPPWIRIFGTRFAQRTGGPMILEDSAGETNLAEGEIGSPHWTISATG
jgi:hypothetical protein